MPTQEAIAGARARRLRIPKYVTAYQRDNGCAPSRAEIAKHTGVSQRTSTRDLLWLRVNGYVWWDPTKARSLRLTR